jgi:hypothetical protein
MAAALIANSILIISSETLNKRDHYIIINLIKYRMYKISISILVGNFMLIMRNIVFIDEC